MLITEKPVISQLVKKFFTTYEIRKLIIVNTT